MDIGVKGLGGNYVWTFSEDLTRIRELLDGGWSPANFWSARHSDTRQAVAVDALPQGLDALFICAPDGASMFANDELQWTISRELRRNKVWKIVRGGQPLYDWVGNGKPQDLLYLMISGKSPFNANGKPSKNMENQLWPPGTAMNTIGTFDCDGQLTFDGRTFSIDPSREEILAMAPHVDLGVITAAMKKRGWGTIQKTQSSVMWTLTEPVVDLIETLNLSTEFVSVKLEMPAESARAVLECLDRVPTQCTLVIHDSLAPLSGVLSDTIKRLTVRTDGVQLAEVTGLPPHAVVEVLEMPDRDVVEHVLNYGPTISVQGMRTNFGLGQAIITAAEPSPLLASVILQRPISLHIQPADGELPTAEGERILKRLAEFTELRILPQIKGTLALSGTLPVVTGPLPLLRLDLQSCGLGDDDIDRLRAIVDASPDLQRMDIQYNYFTSKGLERLGLVPGLACGEQGRPIPPEWRAKGLNPLDLPVALAPQIHQLKWEGPNAPWDELAPVLKRSLARGSAHLVDIVSQSTPPPSKGFIAAVTRFDKAMNARSFTQLMSRGNKAIEKFSQGAKGPLHQLGQKMRWAFKKMHGAYALDNNHDYVLDESDFDQARIDYEIDWLYGMSEALVHLAGCAANWEPDAPQLGYGCPAERQDQIDTWAIKAE